jgi:hypothetical protein
VEAYRVVSNSLRGKKLKIIHLKIMCLAGGVHLLHSCLVDKVISRRVVEGLNPLYVSFLVMKLSFPAVTSNTHAV